MSQKVQWSLTTLNHFADELLIGSTFSCVEMPADFRIGSAIKHFVAAASKKKKKH
jgi:hypothetical protein